MSTLVQTDDYYPFGLSFNSYSSGVKNDFLYNGKELQDELDLGWYDYGARMQDPTLGRFFTQDRFAEKYLDFTPYHYAANNPILYIDINGDSVDVSHMGQENRDKLVSSLSKTTGLTLTVGEDGNVTYAKNDKGKAEVARDENGKKVGSRTARKALVGAIKNENTLTVTDKEITKGSLQVTGHNIINLDPNQIGQMMENARGFNKESVGWGTSFFHEYSHTPMGGNTNDPNSETVASDPLGGAVRFVNTIRRELGYATRTKYSPDPSTYSKSPTLRNALFSRFSTGSTYTRPNYGAMSYSDYARYLNQNGIR